jgi:hypothetical protein
MNSGGFLTCERSAQGDAHAVKRVKAMRFV